MNHRIFCVIALAMSIAGCTPMSFISTSTRNEWIAQPNIDPFADEPTCRVTMAHVRDGVGSGGPFTYQVGTKIYPVVIKRGTSIYVGATSVPMKFGFQSIQQPVGDVQLKIGQFSSWTIAAAETPNLAPKGASAEVSAQKQQDALEAMPAPSPYFDPKAMAGVTQAMMSGMSYLGSPVTLASGAKAVEILQQMKTGPEIMYRPFAGNAAGDISSFSMVGFNEAAQKCGL